MWTQRGLINKQYGNAFGAVTRIRPIIITFGTTNVVGYSLITFGVSISMVPCQDVLTFSTIHKHSVTFGVERSDSTTFGRLTKIVLFVTVPKISAPMVQQYNITNATSNQTVLVYYHNSIIIY